MTIELETLLIQRKKSLDETTKLEKQIEELTSRLEEEETLLHKVNTDIAHLLGIKTVQTPAQKLSQKKTYQASKLFELVAEQLTEKPQTAYQLSDKLGIKITQIRRALNVLKEKQLTQRIGWSHTAAWVKSQPNQGE